MWYMKQVAIVFFKDIECTKNYMDFVKLDPIYQWKYEIIRLF